MRVVIQRVTSACVEVDGIAVGKVGNGVVLLVGVTHGDTEAHSAWIARRVADLRIFPDASSTMNRSLLQVGGGALVISQFTLYADSYKGRRPSYAAAASPDFAAPLVDAVARGLSDRGLEVATGRFGAHMNVQIHGDGPVTIILDTSGVPSLART
jgi:D-tyrosyl-tRNA(Tyr) deacylase